MNTIGVFSLKLFHNGESLQITQHDYVRHQVAQLSVGGKCSEEYQGGPLHKDLIAQYTVSGCPGMLLFPVQEKLAIVAIQFASIVKLQ